MIKLMLQKPLVRFCFVGGLTYIVDIGILIGLHSGLHAQRTVATAISFWIGLLFSFVLQKLVAFQDYKRELSAVTHQTFWYAVLVIFNYFLTLIIVSLFPDKDLILSRTIAVAVTAVWNYFFYKHIVFRTNKEKGVEN